VYGWWKNKIVLFWWVEWAHLCLP